ncbi:hypothetical protein [Nonomuraea sp. 10N515B]|uniref:hypothetical protein n=1 Tax=Nonomuraea sp. 10N515B TaxID=3457422 RepID=UPI003FCDE46A
MTLPRTVADVLSDHVVFEIESIDRMYLNLYQPRLQHGGGIAAFFIGHRGHRFASSALMAPMTETFVANLHHYIAAHGLDLVHFRKGQRKDDLTQQYLAAATEAAGPDGLVPEQVLYVGRAQEKNAVFRTIKRTNPVTGATFPWLVRDTAMVNHFYLYAVDDDFGPICVKFSTYFPYTGRLIINGNEYAKRQAAKAGIGFTSLDNAFAAIDDPAAVQRICDGLTAEKIEALAAKWLARLPHPFTAEDIDAGYTYRLSMLQTEFSLTQMLDRPLSGRIFFEQMIRDNLDLGRPDKVSLIFDRKILRKGKNVTPGRFRTRVLTEGVDPSVHIDYKNSTIKQYFKQGRALRTETTINDTSDFALPKGLSHLPALAQIGFTANRRLLDVQRISHDPADGAAALTAITVPITTATGTRIAGLRLLDHRVQALLTAICVFRLLPHGFTNRDLRHHLAPLLGRHPEDMTSGQIGYDLRRLRAHGLITKIPHTHRYLLTPDGHRHARFLTRLTQRFLIPGLAQLNDPDPPPTARLRAAAHAYDTAIDDLAQQAGLAA